MYMGLYKDSVVSNSKIGKNIGYVFSHMINN